MPQFLTPEQVNEIKRIIAKRHAAIILRVLGPDALTPEEKELLDKNGIQIFGQESAIRNAYLFGQLQGQMDKPSSARMSYEAFKKRVAENPVTLSQPEEHAVRAAELHAGAHIRHLGANIEQQASMLIFREDSGMRARLLDEIKPEITENIRKRESIGKLKKELGWLQRDWRRDWNRVAITEKTNAMNQGIADTMKEQHGDTWVYKRPMPDACKQCVRLHIGPDDHPRIFRLSALEANGTNVGKKAADWMPVVGTTHPHCQCQIIRVPDGWGFDENDELVPGGKFGIRYETLDKDDLSKAVPIQLRTEDIAATSQMGNRAVSPTAGGVNLIVQSPMNHAGAMSRPATIKHLKEYLAGYTNKDRERYMVQIPNGAKVYNLSRGPAENVYPYQHSAAREELDEQARAQIPNNRKMLDNEIAKRLVLVAPNVVLADPDLKKRKKLQKGQGALFIGPRGGLWANPQHTVPYKPVMVRTPLHAVPSPAPAAPKVWKEGLLPGIKPVDWTSWKIGHRGGTEEKYYNHETHSFTPDRAKLHRKIVQKFLDEGKSHKKVKGVAPTAIISMGGPASGKSTLLERFGDDSDYVRIDPDKIKSELPEYQEAKGQHMRAAAEMVHMESTVIANDLLTKTLKSKKNLMFDTTGADTTRLLNQIQKLRSAGYRIALVMPHVDRGEMLHRAKTRAETSGRWVPEAAIHDVHAKVVNGFGVIAQHVDTAYLYDNTGDVPQAIYEKHGDHQMVHDTQKAALFPGLPMQKAESGTEDPLLSALKQLALDGRKMEIEQSKQPRKYDANDGMLDVDQIHDWISLVPDTE